MARELRCSAIITGCDTVIRGADDQDVLRRVAVHAADAHGISQVDDDTLARIRAAIREGVGPMRE